MDISNEAQKVYEYIFKYQPIRPNVIVKGLGLSEKTIYKHLASLLKAKKIEKNGDKGKIFYTTRNIDSTLSEIKNLNDTLIESYYIYVSPNGEIIRGLQGFNTWCNKNSLNSKKVKAQYIKRLKELNKLKKNGLLSGKDKILSGQKDLFIDEVFFSDFYTFNHFGKTKLGQLIYVAKNSQNVELIDEISTIIYQSIQYLIDKYAIKMICYIPPTIDRKIQIMHELENSLNIQLPKIKIEKVSSKTKIAQKTLKKLEDRIINAQKTISVNPIQEIIGNVLIIDDATGSGATLNETAKKIKLISKRKTKIIGYTVVGSYKGFDVISEV